MINTSPEKLMSIWKDIGIETGDSIVCHSSLFKLGKIEGGINSIVKTLLKILGKNGNIVVPTFTYSFMKNTLYDVENSPSTVGILGDLIRQRNDSLRSLDGNFSWSAIGKNKEEFMQIDTKESFGKNSLFDKLRNKNGKCLLLGVDFDALPFFMFLEKEFNVPYRYNKEFSGETKIGETVKQDSFIHYVRDEKFSPKSARLKIGKLIRSDPCCKIRKIGYGEAIYVPLTLVQQYVEKHLLEDPFILLEEPVG